MKSVLIFALASVASGALFCLALPPAGQWYLGWVAFVPILAAVRGKGFLIGFGAGLLSLFTTAYLARTGVFYPEKSWEGTDAWIYTGCGLFGFSVSILTGIWADKSSLKKPIWWFAALAVALESILLLQLPAHLALTQYRNHFILFLASLGGIWLSGFVVWLVNLLVASWAKERKWVHLIGLGCALMVIQFGFTIAIEGGQPSPGKDDIAAIQTAATDRNTMQRLVQEAADKEVPICVWPESAGIELAPGGDTKEIEDLAKSTGVSIVTSFNDRYLPNPHNTAALMTATNTSAFYYKRKLFGGEKRFATPGDDPLAVPFGSFQVGLNICFDSCYPSIIRDTCRFQNVKFVALPTIDPPSPHHFIAAIHAAFTPFRAAENGIAFVRADGFAYSMIVQPSGRISKLKAPGEGVLLGHIEPPGMTLYRLLGDWFLYLCIAAVVFGIFRYRQPKTDPTNERLQAFAEKTLKEKGLEDLLP